MKREYKIYLISTILFLFVLYLFLIQSIFHFFPELGLSGVVEKPQKPEINLRSWFSGETQKQVEDLLDKSLGFRSHLIRSDNQLNYWLFKESYQKTNSKIIIGKENYLYENNYIKSYLARDAKDLEFFENKVIKLKKLQDLLAERGIEFIFLIAPSKAVYYSEYLPDRLIYKTAEKQRVTNYEKIIPLLDEYKINYLDGRKMFADLKGGTKYKLFSKSGAHWTYYGSCLMTQKIFTYLGDKKTASLNIPDCEHIELNSTPQGDDVDLSELINIWTPKIFYETLAYPKFNTSSSQINDLNFLIVGDSFVWGILKNIKDANLLNDYNFYYYFKTNYDKNRATKEINQKDTAYLKEEILKNNVVILENNEAGLASNDFGFLEASFEALDK